MPMHSRPSRLALLALLLLALLLSACGSSDSPAPVDPPTEPASILTQVQEDARFSALASLLVSSDLDLSDFEQDGLTLFAPSNEAIAAIADNAPSGDILDNILRYHVVLSSLSAEALGAIADSDEGMCQTALFGLCLFVERSASGLLLEPGGDGGEAANVITADIAASNGVIHLIDRVLIPPTLAGGFNFFNAEGFEAIEAAIQASGFFDTLAEEGPFTLFVPNQQAFLNLGFAGLTALLSDPAAFLNLLEYHLIEGQIEPDGFTAGAVTSRQGSQVLISLEGDNILLNGSATVLTDMVRGTRNGLVYLIDAVLELP